MIERNDPCWCGSGKKWKKCHFLVASAPHSKSQSSCTDAEHYLKKYRIILKTAEQIEGIRKAGRLAAKILEDVCARAKEGTTTEQLDDFATQLHREAGAVAAPLGYGNPPYPKSICTSINDVICHGIPDKRALQKGDILNIDVTCILNGYYGDCSKMVIIGTCDEEKQLVVDVAYECLMRSIATLQPGALLSQIGEVIESYAEQHHCSVVNRFIGHGVGLSFHEPPQILHCRNSIDIPIVPGMTFTIEPMINAGRREAIIDSIDRWTARTIDNKPSAQWEHTVLITETGCEVLTPWKR